MASKVPKPPRRHVALVYPLILPWITSFVRGVMDYADEHGGWSVTTSPPPLANAGEEPLRLSHLRGWPGDGVIASVLNQADVRTARRLGIPVLSMASTMRDTGLPRVRPDHYAMGRMAAEHLLERGLRRLAYYGIQGFWFSEERCRGFVERAEQAGATCDVLEVPWQMETATNWRKRTGLLVRWLKQLRPPVGLLAVQDYRARAAIEQCERLGLCIPHDMAVIGMEDNTTLCEFCRPTLSSVARDSWRQGYEAATMLDRLMDGRPTPTDVVIPPAGIVARQSTDTISVEDPHLAAALHFIHDHLDESFGIEQVVKATSISRRQLEIRFRRVLGCTPHDYLSRKRIEQVKQLLAGPEKVKLHKIAIACGFPGAKGMRLVFKRVTGMTPLEYRRAKQVRKV